PPQILRYGGTRDREFGGYLDPFLPLSMKAGHLSRSAGTLGRNLLASFLGLLSLHSSPGQSFGPAATVPGSEFVGQGGHVKDIKNPKIGRQEPSRNSCMMSCLETLICKTSSRDARRRDGSRNMASSLRVSLSGRFRDDWKYVV